MKVKKSRNVLALLIGIVLWHAGIEGAPVAAGDVQATVPAGWSPMRLDEPIKTGFRALPVTWRGRKYYICRISSVEFHLDEESRLTATASADVITFTRMDCVVHAAVFDEKGRLLATARADCEIYEQWLSTISMEYWTIELDFDVSADYGRAKYFSIAINETNKSAEREARKRLIQGID